MKTLKRNFTIDDCAFLIAWAAFLLPPVVSRMSSAAGHGVTLLGYTAFVILFIYRRNDLPVRTDFMLFLVFIGYCMFILLVKTPREFGLFARRELLPVFESVFLIKWTLERKQRGFIILYHICAVYIITNFISLIMFPDGIIRSSEGSSVERAQWLFGSKNNIPLYMIVFITMAAYYYYTVRRTKMFYVLVFMSAFSILMSGEQGLELLGGSSTGLIAFLAVFVLLVYYMQSEKKQRASFAVKGIFIGVLLINLIILTGQNIPGMEELIVNVFHKTVTFTGRKFVWDLNLTEILNKPIFGHGEVGVMAHVYIERAWRTTDYTYNLILKILLNYGLVGLGIFIAMIMKIDRSHETSDCILFTGFIGLMFIGMMNEITMQWLLLFPLMLIVSPKSLPATTVGRARRIRPSSRKSMGLHVKI